MPLPNAIIAYPKLGYPVRINLVALLTRRGFPGDSLSPSGLSLGWPVTVVDEIERAWRAEDDDESASGLKKKRESRLIVRNSSSCPSLSALNC